MTRGVWILTKEVDALIAVHAASGAPGVVTDIATPGVHTPWNPPKSFGAHYRPGTKSASGEIGVAVDFGGLNGPLPDEQALQVFQAFEADGRAGKLSELYCGQAEYCVFNGAWMRWTSIPKQTRDAIRPKHMNHIHVSVQPGVFLAPTAQPQEPQPEEEDLPQYEFADGGIVSVNAKGEVFCPEMDGRPVARHYGGMTQLRDDAKQGFEKAVAIVGVDRNNSQGGYRVFDQRWIRNGFQFAPGVEMFFKR